MCCSVWPRANDFSGSISSGASPSSRSGSPPHAGPTAAVGEVDRARHQRVVGERLPRVDHLARLVEQEDPPVVRDAVLDERLDDLEAQAAGVVGACARRSPAA